MHGMESLMTMYTKSNTCDGKVGAKKEYSLPVLVICYVVNMLLSTPWSIQGK